MSSNRSCLELLHPEDRKVRRSLPIRRRAGDRDLPDSAERTCRVRWRTEQDPNFTKMRQYGDLDALIELYGHLRAENPTSRRLPSTDD